MMQLMHLRTTSLWLTNLKSHFNHGASTKRRRHHSKCDGEKSWNLRAQTPGNKPQLLAVMLLLLLRTSTVAATAAVVGAVLVIRNASNPTAPHQNSRLHRADGATNITKMHSLDERCVRL